jgi:hypothetical protein
MYLNVKVTAWRRIIIPDIAYVEEIKKLNETHSVESLTNYICNEFDTSWDPAPDDIPECMEPTENGGAPTLELYHDDGEMIWDNGRKPDDVVDVFKEINKHFKPEKL